MDNGRIAASSFDLAMISVVACRYGKDGVIPVTQSASMAELVKV